jgi:hypothetical protein
VVTVLFATARRATPLRTRPHAWSLRLGLDPTFPDPESRLPDDDQPFQEEDGVPADAAVLGETWGKVNKDGTRLRYLLDDSLESLPEPWRERNSAP